MTQHGGAEMVRRRLRFTVVLLAVVLALTGFQSGLGARKGGGGSGGGGGCSSSKKGNGGGGHGSDYSDDDHGSGSGGDTTAAPTPSASTGEDVAVAVVDCVEDAGARKRTGARKGKRKGGGDDTTATVRVTSRAAVESRFAVRIEFLDDRGKVVDRARTSLTLDAGESRAVELRMGRPQAVDRVVRCAAAAERA
ncbi:hypothetical protein [Streptomyces sp. NPDC046887]|uniref:hypothetical protein n=1 Tax=Streptomyces sp. NPDC046887 TaxID=3155472 RepID=UPI0033E434E3